MQKHQSKRRVQPALEPITITELRCLNKFREAIKHLSDLYESEQAAIVKRAEAGASARFKGGRLAAMKILACMEIAGTGGRYRAPASGNQ